MHVVIKHFKQVSKLFKQVWINFKCFIHATGILEQHLNFIYNRYEMRGPAKTPFMFKKCLKKNNVWMMFIFKWCLHHVYMVLRRCLKKQILQNMFKTHKFLYKKCQNCV